MFQWSIVLSDKQVMMLAAFYSAMDDADGSRFSAVNAMIGDAWDVRSARKLQETGLISIDEYTQSNGLKTNRWNITKKGECIAEAIMCDAATLSQIKLRSGLQEMRIVDADGNEKRDKRDKEKRDAKKESNS